MRAETGRPGKQNWLEQVLLVVHCSSSAGQAEREGEVEMMVWGVSGSSEFKGQQHPGDTESIQESLTLAQAGNETVKTGIPLDLELVNQAEPKGRGGLFRDKDKL